MKNFNFIKKELEEIPQINEKENFELFMNENIISEVNYIPPKCIKLSLKSNK
jgi:hypothetical protein